jgi:ADP-ribose pyrophosphatase YjhB (NUDIX family)/phosphohistidine phosphatase SixA
VVWRCESGLTLVAVVHRPRYDDWSLPKGKVNAREPLVLAAVREVREETGARVEVGRRLRTVSYQVAGVTKRVSYWSMRYRHGELTTNAEVDRMLWLPLAESAQLMTYSLDRAVLADFARLPADTNAALLVRHAKAGKRSAYSGDDRLRPLDKIGRRQARDSVEVLRVFRPRAVVAADRIRCRQTMEPLAESLGVPVETDPAFADEAYLDDPHRTRDRLLAYCTGATTAICSQGTAIPLLVKALRAEAGPLPPSRKGSLWTLSIHRGDVIAADYYSHPQI